MSKSSTLPSDLSWRSLSVALLGVLLAILAVYAVVASYYFVSAIRYPFELDYGEGIVWQQAVLIPGPRMYGTSTDLPFIVFHYPPLYYLLTHVAAGFMPDMLSAGRLVSAIATWLIVPLIAALVLTCVPRTDDRPRGIHVTLIAIAAGLLALSLHPVRLWGPYMRVDMVAVTFSLAGILVAARTSGSFLGILCALLLCAASVFTKQTELPAGSAVFLVMLLRRPGATLGAAAVTLGVCLAALLFLQHVTGGGFLLNIVGYNVNRLAVQDALRVLNVERSNVFFVILVLVGAWAILRRVGAAVFDGGVAPSPVRFVGGLRRADPTALARTLILTYFALASLMLLTLLKSGGNANYLIDWMCVGCVLIGVLLCDLAASERRFRMAAGFLIFALLVSPARAWLIPPPPHQPEFLSQAGMDEQGALVKRIAAADKPVASENMTLLMRAGKPVIFESSIVTELAAVGRWDETPLVRMISSGGFAFVITTPIAERRTPAVDAAIQAAYPRVEQVAPDLVVHLPR